MNQSISPCDQYRTMVFPLRRVQVTNPDHRAMQSFREFLFGRSTLGTGDECCYDNQYRPTHHGREQRYVSPTTGRCKPLVVQAVRPRVPNIDRIEVPVGENAPKARKLAIWLVLNPPLKPEDILLWLMRWMWFTLALIWPFNTPKYTGFYPAYLSRFYGHLWVARSPREYSLRTAQLGEKPEPIKDITYSPYPRRLKIYDPKSKSWNVCSEKEDIKRQKYIAISFRHEDVFPSGSGEEQRDSLQQEFITKVEAAVESLKQVAYWIDLTMVEKRISPEEVSKDLYRMADIYRGAQFTLVMLSPNTEVTENEAWVKYGERLWTFPEVLLSRKLYFKFGNNEAVPITLHQLALRAYSHLPDSEESAIVNAYGLRDPLERLERLSLLKSALWRRKSKNLEKIESNPNAQHYFRAERVYALMGFFEHRIHPDPHETVLQALVRLSMANDNDRIVERMISFLPSQIVDTTSWYAEEDLWESKLWDIEPEVQVVGMADNHSVVLGGCRAAAIRWKDFPSVAFAMRRSWKRLIANYLPNVFWELLLIGIILEAGVGATGVSYPGAWVPLVIAIILMLFAPFLVAYGTSGRIVQAQPWLVGVKGLISAEEASTLMYGGAIIALPRTFYTTTGTLLSKAETGQFRRGDPEQLEILKSTNDDDLYTLIDTLTATIYYFRAARPPTVCLYTGRESGMGRFVLCSERCTANMLHKETVIRMPWHISQSMRACDWVALG